MSLSVGCRLCTDAHIFITNVVNTVDYVYYLIPRFKIRKKIVWLFDKKWCFSGFGALSHHRHLCIRLIFNDSLRCVMAVINSDRQMDRYSSSFYPFQVSTTTLKPRIFMLSFLKSFWETIVFSSQPLFILDLRLFMDSARGSHCHI